MHITHAVGALRVLRVTEQIGLGFTPTQLYPDWDPAVVSEHRDALVPRSFDPDEGRFISSIHSWLFRLNEKNFLVDTCAGNDKERPGLPRFHRQATPYLDRLRQAGLTPEDVDFVMCTHLHADHCGWNTRLLDGRWVPTFPNARYVFSRGEADHWSRVGDADPIGAQVYTDSVLPILEAGRAEVVEGNEVFLDGLHLHPTPGHSPGHMAIELTSGDDRALFTGDIMHQPVQIFRPDWNSAFCSDPQAARQSRRWALETAVETGATVFTAHFAGSSAGRVSAQAERFDWRYADPA